MIIFLIFELKFENFLIRMNIKKMFEIRLDFEKKTKNASKINMNYYKNRKQRTCCILFKLQFLC